MKPMGVLHLCGAPFFVNINQKLKIIMKTIGIKASTARKSAKRNVIGRNLAQTITMIVALTGVSTPAMSAAEKAMHKEFGKNYIPMDEVSYTWNLDGMIA